jgi:uncharacterized protein YggU (UPF0235/DUF167 family)
LEEIGIDSKLVYPLVSKILSKLFKINQETIRISEGKTIKHKEHLYVRGDFDIILPEVDENVAFSPMNIL